MNEQIYCLQQRISSSQNLMFAIPFIGRQMFSEMKITFSYDLSVLYYVCMRAIAEYV